MKISSILRFLPFKVHRFIWHARDISSKSSLKISNQPFQFRELTAADLPKFARLVGKETLAGFEVRFTRGELCHGVFENDRLVAFGWTSLKGGLDERTHLRIDLAPGQAYTYHFLVDPEYRNQDVGTTLVLMKDECLLRRGVVLVFSAIDFRNYASRRMNIKTGHWPIKIIYVIRIFGKMIRFERRFISPPPKPGVSHLLTGRSPIDGL
jgi:GNAT superfamily N-acetyltransferase